MAIIEQEKAKFAEFKTEYISENGHERGMLKAWKSSQGEGLEPKRESAAQENTEAIIISAHPQYGDVTEADIMKTMSDTGMTREEIMMRLQGG